tara:strand:+ start:6118 stop:8844 length:2727 start_codon:yes stop_codon:yes gene_type:complete
MSKKDYISIQGARMNNLKNISVNIPKNKLVVITGVSGSGKSTLAYDTIYSEAQRRYIESLSSYARQFLKNHPKPEVDSITGLSPAIAIEQKTNINNARSTVGTSSEIYYYLTLLFEKIGKTFSPISGKEVKKTSFIDCKKYINQFKLKTKFLICCPIKFEQLKYLEKEGFSRIIYENKIIKIQDVKENMMNIHLVIDRLIYNSNDDFEFNLKEAFNKGIELSSGNCIIYDENIKILKHFRSDLYLDNIIFEQPNKDLFNFNSPYGACEKCKGHGDLLDLDLKKIIPNKNLSLLDDAIHPWRSGKMNKWKKQLIQSSKDIGLSITKKYSELSETEIQILWNGKGDFKGLHSFFNLLTKKAYKIQYRVMLSKYRSLNVCPACNGSRLRKESEYILIQNQNIQNIINLSLNKILSFIQRINQKDEEIITKITDEILSRTKAMINLGLGYLTLNRKSNTLSGGEIQKINITKSIGSGLIGSLYILDEPSIGLHSKDTVQLIKILQKLKKLGNSIIIVEHDKEIIKSADYIIDLGPLAGNKGGKIIYQGLIDKNPTNSLTLNYIYQKNTISNLAKHRIPKEFIKIKGVTKNNIKNLNFEIPTNILTSITGVSGSGKTTLLKEIFLPIIKRKFKDYSFPLIDYTEIEFNSSNIENIEFLDHKSIKKSSKSTPITYINAFDQIRSLFASQQTAKINNLNTKHFSFNTKDGRCLKCNGQGEINIEMQFLSDIKLKCERCNGTRYKNEILNIQFKNKNISEILNFTIEEGEKFFLENNQIKIANSLQPLIEVGLGYLKIGQSVSTLSSGEAQRLKLASFLSKKNSKSILIFDEPTKGLHFYDIEILIRAFQKLINIGNSIIVIEHNIDIIKNSDWIIDLGPEGGLDGGNIIFSGTPNDLIKKNTHTATALKKEINDV